MKICIVGGGTAGWMAAAHIERHIPESTITLIESPTIPIIGVGESSLPQLRNFFNELGIDDATWVSECNGLIKNGNENELNHLQVKSLKQYLKNCLERKQLQNVKDVIYNKEEQKITSIPNLNINKDKKFTLKRSERRPSTLKSLVPPKSIRKKKKSDE